jgi:hypothetical protein
VATQLVAFRVVPSSIELVSYDLVCRHSLEGANFCRVRRLFFDTIL